MKVLYSPLFHMMVMAATRDYKFGQKLENKQVGGAAFWLGRIRSNVEQPSYFYVWVYIFNKAGIASR